jgi:3-methyladenine DNA glycosylase AlkD
MTVHDVLTKLDAIGTEQLRAQNVRHGYVGEQYGVKLGELRAIAKAIKLNTTFGLELWARCYVEAYTRCGLQKSCGQLATETM